MKRHDGYMLKFERYGIFNDRNSADLFVKFDESSEKLIRPL